VKNNNLNRSVVLVVDDHPDTLQLLIDTLEDAGVTVLIATDGKRALEQVVHLLPDLILLDAVMPGMDGFETCRALKSGLAAGSTRDFYDGPRGYCPYCQRIGGRRDRLSYQTDAPDELIARMRVHLSLAREAQGVRTALDASGRTMLAPTG